MPNLDTALLPLISQCAKNKKLTLDLKDNILITKKESLFSIFKDKSSIIQYILLNQDAIQNAVTESYNRNIDCTNFQKQVTSIFSSRKKFKAEAPDFLKNYTSKWMSYLSEENLNKPLDNLLVPGTHDTGSYKLTLNVVPAIVNGWQEKFIYNLISLPIINDIVSNWTITQNDSIAEQLEKGIRLLDLRLGKSDKGDLYITHTFLTEKFEESLQQIANFIAKYTTEVIRIRLRIDYEYRNNMTTEDVASAFNSIHKIIGDKILPANQVISSIQALVNGNHNIIFYADLSDQYQKIIEDETLIRIGGFNELWPNTNTPEEALIAIKESLGSNINQYNYISFNTTPDVSAIVKGVFLGQSLKIQGHIMQKNLSAFLASNEIETSNSPICGITLDDPTICTVQEIINKNHSINMFEVY